MNKIEKMYRSHAPLNLAISSRKRKRTAPGNITYMTPGNITLAEITLEQLLGHMLEGVELVRVCTQGLHTNRNNTDIPDREGTNVII